VVGADDARQSEIGAFTSPDPPAGSAAKTSSAAPIPFSRIARSRAASSTTSARDVFTKKAPFFNAAKNSSPQSPRVSGFKARWTDTTSASRATSAPSALRAIPPFARPLRGRPGPRRRPAS
jgi:hypothetical protein